MRILQIIHGYPPYYMAGSEVYTYNLSKELAKRGHEVYVFSRIENPFLPLYSLKKDYIDGVSVLRVNKGRDYSLKQKYIDEEVDEIFSEYMDEVKPDVVHVQHLSHLSTNIINIAKEKYKVPVIFTAHDFWMFCIRGQLIMPDYKLCYGPELEKCVKCLYYLQVSERDIEEYQKHMRRVINNVDYFLIPSRFLYNFYIRMGVDKRKLIYSPYGFYKEKISFRRKEYSKGSKITFGFTGRIIPAKGIHILLKAFNRIVDKKGASLKIYGNVCGVKQYLEELSDENVFFMGGYHNDDIDDILDSIDVLVVPSIWYENSPLVIQEAFLKGIPVITSNIGGMAELVDDGIDGFLFEMGNINSLQEIMEKIIKDPSILNTLKIRRDKVRDIRDDVNSIEHIYRRLVK